MSFDILQVPVNSEDFLEFQIGVFVKFLGICGYYFTGAITRINSELRFSSGVAFACSPAREDMNFTMPFQYSIKYTLVHPSSVVLEALKLRGRFVPQLTLIE